MACAALRRAGLQPAAELQGRLARLPGSHYVGITHRADPMKRIKEHGAWCAQHVVELRQGTEDEEQRIKREESCPRCGASLDYYAERLALMERARRSK